MQYTPRLQEKIDCLMKRRPSVKLGGLSFSSPLLLAPMASIGNAPFRQLMQELGSGGQVSELISSDGIVYQNPRTFKMLETLPSEERLGLQIFGDDEEMMKKAAQVVVSNPLVQFVDINMGCPVRKVVGRGGGAALLKETPRLGRFFAHIKKELPLPLSIKIRTGWCESEINAAEIIHIAQNEGIEWVAIHGRTREQQYKGQANWGLLEELASNSPLPIIGNGDLHSADIVRARLKKTSCQALMLGRGPLRNPFLFLESFITEEEESEGKLYFCAADTWEVILRLHHLIVNFFPNPHLQLIQLRKLIVWYASGYPHVSKFRSLVYAAPDMDTTLRVTEDYFMSLGLERKFLNYQEAFMTSGHG